MRRPSGDQAGNESLRNKNASVVVGEAGDAGAVGVHHVDLRAFVAQGERDAPAVRATRPGSLHVVGEAGDAGGVHHVNVESRAAPGGERDAPAVRRPRGGQVVSGVDG